LKSVGVDEVGVVPEMRPRINKQGNPKHMFKPFVNPNKKNNTVWLLQA